MDQQNNQNNTISENQCHRCIRFFDNMEIAMSTSKLMNAQNHYDMSIGKGNSRDEYTIRARKNKVKYTQEREMLSPITEDTKILSKLYLFIYSFKRLPISIFS